MAIYKNGMQIVGTVANMSFYTRRDSDKVIVRSKGGASKSTIKNSPKFEGLRLQQNEWKGCTGFASMLRYAFGGLQRIADYNLTPALNAFAKQVQKLDSNHETGKRSICLSKYRQTINGFNFNRTYPFNSVVRVSPALYSNRNTLTTQVTIPEINCDINLLNVQKLPYYRIIVSLGAISDVVYNEELKMFVPMNDEIHGKSVTNTSEWKIASGINSEITLEAAFAKEFQRIITDDVTLVISIAIEFGQVGFTGQPTAVKYAGSGKVVDSL